MRANHSIKEEQVNSLVKKMKESASFAAVKYSALGSKSSEWLRKELKKYEGEIKMVSNNVLRRALSKFSDSSEKYSIAGQHFLLLVKSDQISPLKLLANLVKKYELLSLGLVYCNNQFLTDVQREYIPNWLEKNDAIAKFSYLLNYPLISLIFSLKAIVSKKEQQ